MTCLFRRQVFWTAFAVLLFTTSVAPRADAQHKTVIISFPYDSTYPNDINDAGTVVGRLGVDEDITGNFVRFPSGEIIHIPTPNWPNCPGALPPVPTGINNFGLIVGVVRCDLALNPDDLFLPFLRLNDGSLVLLSREHGLYWPISINDSGTILGRSTQCDFVIRNIAGQSRCIDNPDVRIRAVAMNNAATVVGYTLSPSGQIFIYQNGVFRYWQYNDANGEAQDTGVLDINNKGEILAYTRAGNFVLHPNGRVRFFTLPVIQGEQCPAWPTQFNRSGDVTARYCRDQTILTNAFISYRLAK